MELFNKYLHADSHSEQRAKAVKYPKVIIAGFMMTLMAVAGCLAGCDLNQGSWSSDYGPGYSGQPVQPGERKPAVVKRVVDGDTIEVFIDGRQETVRLIGLNTPETWKSPQGAEPWGDEASAFTSKYLTGQAVDIEYDVDKRDQYGRLLAYVWLDGQLYNEILVLAGWADARTYSPNTKYQELLDQAETEARAQHLGQWQ